MVALKFVFVLVGSGLLGSAGVLLAYDIYFSERGRLRRALWRQDATESGGGSGDLGRRELRAVRWRLALQFAAAGALAVLLAESFVVIPDGAAGVRVSELWGVRPGTFYPGLHLVTPLVDTVAIYDTREQVYVTAGSDNSKQTENGKSAGNSRQAVDVLTVQARE